MALVDSYSESNQDSAWPVSAGAGLAQKVGQTFISTGGQIGSAKFYLKKNSTPTGNATAVLYAHTGTFGTNGTPTGVALATSDTFDVSTLTGSYQLVTFNFPTPYNSIINTEYCISFEYSGGDSGKYVDVGRDATSPSHAGNNFVGGIDGAPDWSSFDTIDIIFYVYSNDLTTSTSSSTSSTSTSVSTSTSFSTSSTSMSTSSTSMSSSTSTTLIDISTLISTIRPETMRTKIKSDNPHFDIKTYR